MKAVVYALLTTAFIIFLATTSSLEKGSRARDRWLIANRRLGSRHRTLNFDPLVTVIERKRNERTHGHHDDDDHHEDHSYIGNIDDPSSMYFDYNGGLNMTLRLMVLFPFIDDQPNDGYISSLELENWNVRQAKDRIFYRTQKEMAYYDKDGDGEISLREYLHQFSEEEIARNGMSHGEPGWWKEQIDNADIDRNGTLSFNEFMDFLHPEDSNNKDIQRWLLKEKLKLMDLNRDGKLNLEEFVEHVYGFYKIYAEYENDGAGADPPGKKFAQLDADGDNGLDIEELRPMLPYLPSGEVFHAKYYSSYLIHEADDNGDGKLSLDEMLNHEALFYTSLLDVDEDEDDFHDEL